MRTLKVLTILFSMALFTFACGGGSGDGHSHENGDHSHDGEQTEQQDAAAPHGEGPEYTSAYICPMHCEGSGSDEPGQCPECGMDYVKNEKHTEDGHSH